MEVAVAEVTVNVVVPKMEPRAAAIVTEPVPTAFAMPAVGKVLLIVATVLSEELQLTLLVRIWVLLSLYVPVAVNWSVVACAIEGAAGVIAIETSPGATVTLKEPEAEPDLAVIEQLPLLFAVSIPLAETEATVEFEELHIALLVRFCEVLLLYRPVAVSCCDCPTVRLALAPVTCTELRTGGGGAVFELPPPPHAVRNANCAIEISANRVLLPMAVAPTSWECVEQKHGQ